MTTKQRVKKPVASTKRGKPAILVPPERLREYTKLSVLPLRGKTAGYAPAATMSEARVVAVLRLWELGELSGETVGSICDWLRWLADEAEKHPERYAPTFRARYLIVG